MTPTNMAAAVAEIETADFSGYEPKKNWTREEIVEATKRYGIRFLRLQFTDILGASKNVEVPASQFAKALDGDVAFDGSSIEGFVRIEESDMLLKPDLDTFRIMPRPDGGGLSTVARLICDIHQPDGAPFAGCPRLTLKRVTAQAAQLGYAMMAGPEAEFFLFQLRSDGSPTTNTHDAAGYFDLAPVDLGEQARREIVRDLELMGFEVEAAHHEVAPGQHEIDFRYGEALSTADNIATFRFLVRNAAQRHGLHATFLPKPVFGQNGSGMHTHQSLFKSGKNAFFEPKSEHQLSKTALAYIAGILEHARSMCAVTNPLVNSYKRLVPGYEAPTNVAWSMRNRSPMIRIPERRGQGTRVEVRMPDPAANPYLAFAVMLKAGLDGIERKLTPPPAVNRNIYTMSARERARLRIKELPGDLREAIDALEKDRVVAEALGEHIYTNFVAAKRAEWHEYIAQVHQWELDRYLATY